MRRNYGTASRVYSNSAISACHIPVFALSFYLTIRAFNYVSAKAQAALIDLMKEDELLSDEEWSYFKRGRNANSHTHAKNTSVMTYRISTGFEAVMGYLKLAGKEERLAELAQWCIEQVEAGRTAHEK